MWRERCGTDEIVEETVMLRYRATGTLLTGLAAAASLMLFVGAAEDFAFGRRLFLEKADCGYCHGWAGDGAGQGHSPGGAANLRKSQLARDQLLTVIACGVPGMAMPPFDEFAYTDMRCS